MDVKPWEPVRAKMEDPIGWFSAYSTTHLDVWALTAQNGWKLHCILQNGQRIIVRALSEDRKAARMAMKEANR